MEKIPTKKKRSVGFHLYDAICTEWNRQKVVHESRRREWQCAAGFTARDFRATVTHSGFAGHLLQVHGQFCIFCRCETETKWTEQVTKVAAVKPLTSEAGTQTNRDSFIIEVSPEFVSDLTPTGAVETLKSSVPELRPSTGHRAKEDLSSFHGPSLLLPNTIIASRDGITDSDDGELSYSAMAENEICPMEGEENDMDHDSYFVTVEVKEEDEEDASLHCDPGQIEIKQEIDDTPTEVGDQPHESIDEYPRVQQVGLPEGSQRNKMDQQDYETSLKSCGTKGPITEKSYQCQICTKSFSYLHSLKVHERIHTGEKPYKCKYCEMCFTQTGQREKHEKTHSREYHCTHCKKSFMGVTSLKNHECTHMPRKPYQCRFCDMRMDHRGHMNRHEQTHMGKKKHQYKDGGKSFVETAIKMHEQERTGESSYKCKYCNKAFMVRTNAQIHERMHTGERPYKCKYCDTTFVAASDARRHERTHTGEESHQGIAEQSQLDFSEESHQDINISHPHIDEESQMDIGKELYLADDIESHLDIGGESHLNIGGE